MLTNSRRYVAFGCVCLFTLELIYRHVSNHQGALSSSVARATTNQLVYQPWLGDPECDELTVRLAPAHSIPKMSLASYPGSGNTWIRGIIERLTGIFTGSIYEDQQLYANGFTGEMMPVDCGCTIVQKTHLYPQDHTKEEDSDGRAILIIRNPYQALVSFRHFETSGQGHTQVASADQFTGPGWDAFVATEIIAWKETALLWIHMIRHGGVLHYENLIHDRRAQFRKLLHYLGVSVDERRLACTLKHDFKAFKRNSSSLSAARTKDDELFIHKDSFSAEQKKVIDEAIAQVHALLTEKSYDPIPFHHYYFNRTDGRI